MTISQMSQVGTEIVRLLKAETFPNAYLDWANTPIHYCYYPQVDRMLTARETVILVRPLAMEYDRDASDRCTTRWNLEFNVNVIHTPIHDRTPKVTSDPTDPQPTLWEYIDSTILEDLLAAAESISNFLASTPRVLDGSLTNILYDPIFNETALSEDNMFASTIAAFYALDLDKV